MIIDFDSINYNYREESCSESDFKTHLSDWLYHEKYGTIRDSTFDRTECIFKYQILPALNELEHKGLYQIDKNDIKTIMNYNLCKGYSYSTLLKVYRFLSEFFKYKYLVTNEVSTNPTLQVKMFKKEFVLAKQEALKEKRLQLGNKLLDNKTLSKEELELVNSKLKFSDKTAMRVLSDEEIERLKYTAYKKHNSGKFKLKQASFFIFMLNTGLRAGEASGLKYSDFDFSNMTLNIKRSISSVKSRDYGNGIGPKRNTVIGQTKTKGSNAVISVSKTAIEIIKQLRAEEPQGYEGYIIHNGDKPLGPRSLEKRFYNLLNAAGIEKTGLHTLRHTFASKLYEKSGGDTKLVSEQLRHSSVSFTASTYVHLASKYKANAMASFEI